MFYFQTFVILDNTVLILMNLEFDNFMKIEIYLHKSLLGALVSSWTRLYRSEPYAFL